MSARIRRINPEAVKVREHHVEHDRVGLELLGGPHRLEPSAGTGLQPS